MECQTELRAVYQTHNSSSCLAQQQAVLRHPTGSRQRTWNSHWAGMTSALTPKVVTHV